eukprot:7077772-Pyramimonas_sp.AAC.1
MSYGMWILITSYGYVLRHTDKRLVSYVLRDIGAAQAGGADGGAAVDGPRGRAREHDNGGGGNCPGGGAVAAPAGVLSARPSG